MANQENKTSYISSLLNPTPNTDKKPPKTPNKEVDDEDLSFLVINSVAKVKGDIISEGDVVVDGFLEGKINARNLKVTKNGRVLGIVSVKSAEVSGLVEPEISCSERLTIKETGQIKGHIITKEIIVNLGGKFVGTVDEFPETPGEAKTKNSMFT
jgi:cytoskeletal protein CcmA (bactofilin family)